jgi:hypothetical protein
LFFDVFLLITDGPPSGYEFLDLYYDKNAPIVRPIRGGLDGLFDKGEGAIPAVPSDGLQSAENQLLKMIYGQSVDR